MDLFLEKYSNDVTGTLSGFDRLVFRGSLRRIVSQKGMMGYLWAVGILLKEFARHVLSVSKQIKDASLCTAQQNLRPITFLSSSKISKEDEAHKIAVRDDITNGLICVFKSLESCNSYEIYRNRDQKKLELVPRLRKCLHLYHYYIHPVFGFMNARIQTWFPFSIQICINGREWLARQMNEAGIGYQRMDNCFTWIEDITKAQNLMNSQLSASWPLLLKDISRMLNPMHDEIFNKFPVEYYWSVYQSEWASDIMFRSPETIGKLYPSLIHHGITTFNSPDVMRFLGRKITPEGNISHNFKGEVISDYKNTIALI